MVVLNAALWMFEFAIPVLNLMFIPSLELTDAMRTLNRENTRPEGPGNWTWLATGGLASEATTFYRRLASLLACKWGDHYSVVMGWLHCSLSYSLLQSAIACVHGAHSSIGHFHRALLPLDLIQVESNIITNFYDD